jgi:hypothetical protein
MCRLPSAEIYDQSINCSEKNSFVGMVIRAVIPKCIPLGHRAPQFRGLKCNFILI